MMMVMGVIVGVIVAMVVVLVAQQPRADKIDGKAEHRDRNRFAIGDRDGAHHPLHALKGNLYGDDPQDDGAGEGGEIAKFAGAESEIRVGCLPTRKEIGQRGNAQRRGMGRHVPAVGEQRHRAEQRSRHDLADHHDRGQRDHEPGAALVAVVRGAQSSANLTANWIALSCGRRPMRWIRESRSSPSRYSIERKCRPSMTPMS